jgi:hypothetical protein
MAKLCGHGCPHQNQVDVALMIGKINALLGFGRATVPPRLRTREKAHETQQKPTHQLRRKGHLAGLLDLFQNHSNALPHADAHGAQRVAATDSVQAVNRRGC